MKYYEQLALYMDQLNCTAKQLCDMTGLSPATMSRYRSGERVPEINSAAFNDICASISTMALEKGISVGDDKAVHNAFNACTDVDKIDKEQLRKSFNHLLEVLDININKLCKEINYDTSTVFRIRNGSRNPSDPSNFAAAVCNYITLEMDDPQTIQRLSDLLSCSVERLSDNTVRFALLKDWLTQNHDDEESEISSFLDKLDKFDLNDYIRTIHFDEIKVPPTIPFHRTGSKSYFGLKQMMDSELDFLKASVHSRSKEPVTMYSDMPMGEMSKDPDFPKKWMFGTAMILKEGLHINQIHNLDRSVEDMMLGLESWIPMYMTGQISPFYLKDSTNSVFLHLLKVSGSAALTGEAIRGHHAEGRYYLTRNKEELSYYKTRAANLLSRALPLMEIYREEDADLFLNFLRSDAGQPGKRRSILSAPPLYTIQPEYLKKMLERRSLSLSQQERILQHAASEHARIETILSQSNSAQSISDNDKPSADETLVLDEISVLTKEDFVSSPPRFPLTSGFIDEEIVYTYEEYLAHLEQTRAYAETHPAYQVMEINAKGFYNLQIAIHEGKWAMVSKSNTPAIHFVIRHPKLRDAIEKYIPPLID